MLTSLTYKSSHFLEQPGETFPAARGHAFDHDLLHAVRTTMAVDPYAVLQRAVRLAANACEAELPVTCVGQGEVRAHPIVGQPGFNAETQMETDCKADLAALALLP